MLNRLGRTAAAVAALSLASPATAGDFHYFNKPGVSRETYKADVAECIELAGGARAPDIQAPYSPNLIGVAVGAFFAGMMRSRERRRLRNSVERTCMADKGYARMEVEDEVVDTLEKMRTDEERLDRLFALASAAEPVGRRLKE